MSTDRDSYLILIYTLQDDSWRAALNLDGAVARMGFYGMDEEKLWMVSQLAGLHLWEWKAACTEDASGVTLKRVSKFGVGSDEMAFLRDPAHCACGSGRRPVPRTHQVGSHTAVLLAANCLRHGMLEGPALSSPVL